MKAVVLRELGGPHRLVVEEVPDPRPAPGETLVRVRRAAFNRRDVFITQGKYPGIELPKILGSDACGEVAELGAGVAGPPAGTRVVIDPMLDWGDDPRAWRGPNVLGMPRAGTFAGYIAIPAQNVYPAPAALSDDEAAALPLAGTTAYRAVFTRAQVTARDAVLITGIGGGVATFMLAFAKYAGARTIVTSGSDEKLARAAALGADVGLNYRTNPGWARAAREAAGGGGPSVVLEGAGGETLAQCLEIARNGARIVVYGGTLGNADIRPFALFWRHLDVLGTAMGSPADFRAMLALFEGERGLRPVVDGVFPLRDAALAAERVNDTQQFGKVVLALA